MTRLALTLLAALVAVPTAGAQSLNMSLVGRVDPRSQGYSDVWGYVASNGREYAVLSTRSDGGTTIIDVTAVPPVEVKYIPGAGGTGSDVELYGDYAYVSDDQAVVQIVDLSDPANAAVVATFEADPGQPTAGVHTLTVAGDYLYTQGGASPGGVRIWSLANPVAPAYVGEYQPHYIHDIMVRGDTLWGAGIYGNGIDIVDISNRAAPTLINRFNYPGSGAHNFCATTDGSYVFVGDEIGSTGQWTRVFDVRDPMNPELVASIIVDPNSTVHNCHVVGDRIYIAHYDRGARVWDISNPEAPTEIAFYETNVSLMWSVYPHLPSGRLIASDMQQGLFVLELTGTANEPGAEQDVFALTVSPNPVRGEGTIRFTLPEASDVRLAVFDVTGREVAVLTEGARPAGTHTAAVDAGALPPGVYVARLTSDAGVSTRRITIVR